MGVGHWVWESKVWESLRKASNATEAMHNSQKCTMRTTLIRF